MHCRRCPNSCVTKHMGRICVWMVGADWTELHKDELMQNWELAASDKPLKPIAPLM